MKTIVKYIICTIFSLFIFTNVNALEIQSKGAILYNIKDNKILYQQNENDKIQIASLTKIMTAIVTLENIENLDETATLTKEDFKGLAEENLVTAGFHPEQKVTYRDLLYGLLLPSGADAAKSLARLVGEDENNFVLLMNNKAKTLKLKNTHFSNPIGLDDSNNYSTTKEVSEIFMYALKNKDFKKIITTDSYTTSDGTITLKNTIRHNKNVGDYLEGGKTGTTDNAGLCLATIASKNNVNFLLVTTGAPYDKKGPHNYEDAKTIYENFINNYSYQTVIKKHQKILTLKTKYTKKDKVNFYASTKIEAYLPNNYNKKDVTYKYSGIKTITSKIKKNTKLGTLDIYYKNEKLASEKIVLKQKQQFSLIKYLKDHKLETSIALVILTCLILLIRRRTRHGKKYKNA